MIGQAVLSTPKLAFEPILPELVLVGFAIAGLLYEALAKRAEPLVHLSIGLVGVALAAATSLSLWSWDGAATVLGGTVAADRFAVLARLLLLAVAALGLLLGYQYFARSGDEQKGEFTPLLLFATSGMTLIVAAADLIVTFLALEILSLSLYVLTGLTGRRAANEASMKYFLLGAFSSAFFLYGVAMAYGASGTTKIATMALALTGQRRNAVARPPRLRAPRGGIRLQGVRRALPHVDAGRLPGGADPGDRLHVGRDEGRGVRRLDPGAGRRVPGDGVGLGAGRVGPRCGLDRPGEHPRDRADEREAHAGVLEHRSRRLHPHGTDGSRGGRDPLRGLLPGRVRGDDRRRLRDRDARVRQGRGADPDLRLRGPRADRPRSPRP